MSFFDVKNHKTIVYDELPDNAVEVFKYIRPLYTKSIKMVSKKSIIKFLTINNIKYEEGQKKVDLVAIVRKFVQAMENASKKKAGPSPVVPHPEPPINKPDPVLQVPSTSKPEPNNPQTETISNYMIRRPNGAESECLLCRSCKPTNAFHPCGHFGVCKLCSEDLSKNRTFQKKCVVCRREYKKFTRIYLY